MTAGYRVQAEHRASSLMRASEGQLRDLVDSHDRAALRAFLASDRRRALHGCRAWWCVGPTAA